METEIALREWIQSLDLAVGSIVREEELWKLLRIIDHDFFIETDHVQRILDWFKEKLKIQVQVSNDFNGIYSLCLLMAVRSDSNEYFIEKMQLLSVETQLILKNIIQQVMEQVSKGEKRDKSLDLKLKELQFDLDESNMKLQEKSMLVEKLLGQVHDYSRLKEENSRIGEKIQEFEFLKEKYSKTEVLLQKYKKKIDELQPLKELPGLVSKKNDDIYKLQEELRKDGLLKKMMNSYKEQITALETRNSGLQVENKGLARQVKELCTELEGLKESSQETIKILNDRIIEISNQEIDQVVKETLDEVEEIQELNGKISDFRQEISLLTDKILVLENQLDDMSRLKIAFEHDYRKSLEVNSSVQKENADLIRKLEMASDQASLSQKLEEFQKALQNTSILNAEQNQTIKTMTQQLQLAQEECRLNHGQVNSLLLEKESLETRLVTLRERANAADKLLGETKALLSAQESRTGSSDDMGSKLASATQKIVQLTDQNALLHQALRKAKNVSITNTHKLAYPYHGQDNQGRKVFKGCIFKSKSLCRSYPFF